MLKALKFLPVSQGGKKEVFRQCQQKLQNLLACRYFTDSQVPVVSRVLPAHLVATEFVADVLVDGVPLASAREQVVQIGEQLKQDGPEVVKQAMMWQHAKMGVQGPIKSLVELSVVLCNDFEIRKLNKEYRKVDRATDVLSFRLYNDEEMQGMPMVALGDVIICVPIAQNQAKHRNYELLDEIRVLLVHGVLHLLGYDHDKSDEQWELMSDGEQFIIQGLGWKGKGLIEAQGSNPVHEDTVQKPREFRIPIKKFMR